MKTLNVKARDGVAIPCGVWGADGDIILYLHGIESHMGWFKDMANILQARGFCVYAFDRRGSGLSKEERGHIDSYHTIIDDIGDVIAYIKNERPSRKFYLMGICGGGRFAADYAGLYPASIDGLILISPAIKTKVTLPLARKADVILSSFINPKRRIPTPLREDMFTRNEKYIEFIKKDGMKLKDLTARFYRELVLMDAVLGRKALKIDIPILTVLAQDDAIADNDALAIWHKRLKARDKTLKLFAGCCHFLPFEENMDEIVDFISCWIKKREGS